MKCATLDANEVVASVAYRMSGDRAVIANATGCSSIFGGNLPATLCTSNADGRGPARSNSLFEDNAECGLGMRFASDKQAKIATELLRFLAPKVGDDLVGAIHSAEQYGEPAVDCRCTLHHAMARSPSNSSS